MRSVTVGRFVAVVALGAGVFSACGGRSERLDGGEGDADEPNAGRGGTSSGTGGTTSMGGILPMTTGGVAGASGSLGTGGTPACTECPAASYGLLVEGDGEPYEMKFNGLLAFDEAEPPLPPYPDCLLEPLRGTITRCGGAITLRACAGPMNGPPCLEVLGKDARYVDRQGLLWSGFVRADEWNSAAPGVASGTLALEFYDETPTQSSFVLTVEYTFCTQLGVLNIPC